MSTDTRDLAGRIADKIAREAIDYDNEDADGNRHPYVMEHRAATIIRAELAESPELRKVREALERFAKMDREESDLPDDHAILSRGVASDLTILFEGDFREASRALAALDRITGKLP